MKQGFASKGYIYLIVLGAICLLSPVVQGSFQRNVWIYWDEPISQAQIVTQLCYEKLKSVCMKQNYKLELLNKQNLSKKIKNYKKQFEPLVGKNTKYRQTVADLVRFFILEEHGGIWIDLSSILLNGFGWLQEVLQQKSYYATNNFGSNSADPDLLMFYFTAFQSRYEYRDVNNVLINEYPGYEIWFIAAKKKTPAITKLKEQFIEFHKMSYSNMLTTFSNERVFMRIIDTGKYLLGNLAMCYMVQKEQKILDRNLTLFAPRKSAFEELKIWGLHSQYGPLVFAIGMVPKLEDKYAKTIQEVTAENNISIRYFLKMCKVIRDNIQEVIKMQQQALKSYDGSFDKYLQSKPTATDCQKIKWIVDGSYFSLLFKDVNQSAVHKKVTVISLSQRQRWNNYCEQNFGSESILQSFLSHFTSLDKYISVSHWSKVQQVELIENPELTTSQRLNILLKTNITTIILFVVAIPVVLVILSTFLVMARAQSAMLNALLDLFGLKSFEQENLICEDKNTLFIDFNKTVLLILWPILAGLFTELFVQTSLTGKIDQNFQVFILACFYFAAKWITGQNDNLLVGLGSYREIITICNILCVFSLTYNFIYLIDKKQENVLFYTVIVLISLRIHSTMHVLEKNFSTSHHISVLNSDWAHNCIYGFVVVILSLIVVFPNLKYILWPGSETTILQHSLGFLLTLYTLSIYCVMFCEIAKQLFSVIYRPNLNSESIHRHLKMYRLVKLILHLVLLNLIVVQIYKIEDHLEEIVKPGNAIFQILTLLLFFCLMEYTIDKDQSEQISAFFDTSDKEVKNYWIFVEVTEFLAIYVVSFYYLVWGSFSKFDSNDDTRDYKRFPFEIILFILAISLSISVKQHKSRVNNKGGGIGMQYFENFSMESTALQNEMVDNSETDRPAMRRQGNSETELTSNEETKN